MPGDARAAYEFRHTSWFEDDVLECLRANRCALCIADADDELKIPFVSTANWGYLRLRREEYSGTDLKNWMKRISSQSWESAFVFFKHEDEGVGPKLAANFLKLAEGAPARKRSDPVRQSTRRSKRAR